ncbi:cytochrome b5-like heme/Steroid binding domain-containing protein [Ditylenchus destructor]|nr:cytochrome b5-like heme/Steroid binding domain-containing protein [Ditylenchus destructor]
MALHVPGADKKLGRSEMKRKNKVALKPGRGLMDWVKESKTQRMSNYPEMRFVDETELGKHCRQDDCWILLFDTVYDVTFYMDFHPGGPEELMRAAGTDGTDLFNEEHRWVNFRSMLSSCVIGPFNGDRLRLRRPMPEGSEV